MLHVAIVIVNYKGRDDTLACLDSLAALTYPDFSVYVVDQNSGDGFVQAGRELTQKSEWEGRLHIVANGENTGFADGCNRGTRAALDAGAAYVLLLNNDCVVPPDFLEPLIEFAESDAKIGIIGPTMRYFDNREVIWAAGAMMGTRAQSVLRLNGEKVESEPPEPVPVDFIVGAGLMAKRAVWETVGLLDLDFFLYYEEADFCVRARTLGWRVVHVPTAHLWHKVSRSTGTDSRLTQYYMRRNALLYLQKHGTFAARLALLAESLRLVLVWTVQKKRDRRTILLRAVSDYLKGRRGKADI